jgi:hypothetical protein
MSDYTLIGPWILRFLLEHIVAERNLARNTHIATALPADASPSPSRVPTHRSGPMWIAIPSP